MNERLTQIYIYPVKSLGGISLTSAEVTAKGLKYDRRWMLIGADNVALTQRTNPEMALFKTSLEKDDLHIHKTQDGAVTSSVYVDTGTAPEGSTITAHVWDDEVQVVEVHRHLSQWFSDNLSVACKLVAFPEENPRKIDPRYSVNGEHFALADAYPFLIIGQASLDDLNSRLASPVPINRFRPNFVFSGGLPFQEDQWRELKIGNVRFAGVKMCSRCILTTVNQETAERGPEPLRTLSTYRKIGNKVLFGQNLVALDLGVVSVGDFIIHP